MGGGGGGKSGSITIGRYEYVHNVGEWPIEAIDAYHVMLSENTLLKASILFSFLVFLLPSAVYICSILLHVRSISALLYSLLIGALLIGIHLKLVVRESVIIFPAFGVQIETRYRSGRIDRQFVPLSKILKPVLNECVTPITCYWTLSLIIHGEDQLCLVFKELRPPVKMLVPIWKALCASVERGDCKDY